MKFQPFRRNPVTLNPFLNPHHSHCPKPPFAFDSSPKPCCRWREEIYRLDLLVDLPRDDVATHGGKIYAHFPAVCPSARRDCPRIRIRPELLRIDVDGSPGVTFSFRWCLLCL